MAQGNIVFSTDPDVLLGEKKIEVSSIENSNQDLRVHLDRRRGGKIVTLIRGYKGPSADLKELANKLKKKCSVGGSVKNGEILLQGDLRSKILKLLAFDGYIAKPSGG